MSERLEKVHLSSGQDIMVHKKEFCTPPCPIHAPSSHHMITWTLIWRDDRAIFERLCPHGIGHPDPDTMEYIKKMHPEFYESEGVHGCDGCCVKKTEAEEDRELASEYNKGM